MFNQHAKWYKLCNEIEWRRKLSSLNILLASHVWRQDHNGAYCISHYIFRYAIALYECCNHRKLFFSQLHFTQDSLIRTQDFCSMYP